MNEAAKAKSFPCKGCGANFAFNPSEQSLKCPHCGFSEAIPQSREEIREFQLNEALERPKSTGPGIEGRAVKCERCSATFQLSETKIASNCAYCGSNVLVDAIVAQNKIAPEAVLPFQLDKKAANEAFKRWIKGLWFAPNALKRESLDERLHGVYRPYWTFDTLSSNYYCGYRGDYYYTGSGKNRRREVRWTYVSGSFTKFFDDFLVAAGHGETPDVGFSTASCKPFEQQYLSGFEAETYSVEPEQGWSTAKAAMTKILYDEARSRIGGDTQRGVECDSAFSRTTFKLVLLPMYVGTFLYRSKSYTVHVNGETGKVAGQRPWSAWKIFFTVLVCLGLVALFLYLWAQNN
jgi:DNA-directed RNA polymerase subunit RPC12/RpoP